MGCSADDTECDSGERPTHPVTVSKAFWMAESEVTQASYQRLTGTNPSRFKGDALPVHNLNWYEAADYCRLVGGRLPTEAEWEYASRAGGRSARYGSLTEIAWHQANSAGLPHPVKLKAPNQFGLYDMIGNVLEWTSDWYGRYDPTPRVDPKGPGSGETKVLRGGSWSLAPLHSRVSFRYGNTLDHRDANFGFRCVLDQTR